MKPEDRIGQTIGIYKIIDINREIKGSNKIYVCECIYCKNIFLKQYSQLGRASTCTHLYSGGQEKKYDYVWRNKVIGRIFRGIKNRCYNSNDKGYRWYGAKGVRVYDKWLENPKLFEEWALKNGYESGLTIDRIDSDKDYCPENCRWVTSINNSKYKSTTRILTVNGESHTGREWSEILGFNMNLINRYVRFYGKDDTEEFIKRFLNNPDLSNKRQYRESLFDLYMG